MEWKDLTSLQRVHSGLDKRTWNTFPLSAKKTLVKRFNKELQTAKDVGSLEVIKENPEQRAARKDKKAKAQALRKSQTSTQRANSAFDDLEKDIAKARKASGGSVKNYAYGGRVANYSAEKS